MNIQKIKDYFNEIRNKFFSFFEKNDNEKIVCLGKKEN